LSGRDDDDCDMLVFASKELAGDSERCALAHTCGDGC
jgi:hypothetical protein